MCCPDRSVHALPPYPCCIVCVLYPAPPSCCSYALPLQLAATAAGYAPYAGSICSQPSIPATQVQPLLRATAHVLDTAALVLHPFMPRHGVRSDNLMSECTSLVVLLQLSACLLPALYKAGGEEQQLFELHQWQRMQRGLPPEQGWDARVYAAAQLLPCGRLAVLWAALLFVILWHAVVAMQSSGLV